MFKDIIWVGIGGACGSILRYGLTLLAGALALPTTLATFTTNSLGSLLIGFFMATCDKGSWYLFATIGLCGGFTTFSTFSAQAVNFLQNDKYGMSMLYIFGSVVVCLFSVLLGLWLGGKLGETT